MPPRHCNSRRLALYISLLFLAMAVLPYEMQAQKSADDQPQQAKEQASSLAAELAKIEQQIKKLRAEGKNDVADSLERQVLAGLQAFQRLITQRGARPQPQPRPSEPPRPLTPLERQLKQTRSQIDVLKTAGNQKAAGDLLKRLQVLEQSSKTGEFPFVKSNEPEVHLIQLSRGAALPKEFVKGTNRFKLGYAKVAVEYTARPVILVLMGREPILWNVSTAEGARVHAVIVTERQKVTGLDNPLVLSTRRGYPPNIQALTGRSTATKQRADTYTGKPIVVGPNSTQWMSEFLLPQAERVAQLARAETRKAKIEKVQGLKFKAIHFAGEPHSSRGPGFHAASFGDFTIAGPVANTLIPLRHAGVREVITVDREKPLQFALSHHTELVVFEGNNFVKDPPKVPLSADFARRERFSTMAYDSKRNRLMLCARDDAADLFAYDVKEGQWSKLHQLKRRLVALTYVAADDVYWGVAPPGYGRDQQGQLLKIGPDGKTIATIPTQARMVRDVGEGITQLIHTDGLLLMINPSHTRDHSTGRVVETEEQIVVVDPASGDVLFSGPSVVHDGKDRKEIIAAVREITPVDGDGLLARLDRKFSRATKDVQRLREQKQTKKADDLSARLVQLRQGVRGTFPKRDKARLHLVGIHESHAATVRVTDKSGPIVLAVCSYNQATWTVEAEEGVQLERIIVGGYHTQKVKKSPQGVKVDIFSSEQGGAGFDTYDENGDDHEQAVQRVQEHAKLKIATFRGSYSPPSEPIIVGPENGNWRAQEVINGLDRLIADANVDQTTAELAALQEHRFSAIHYGTLPRQPADEQAHRYLSQFTIHGPMIGRSKALAIDPHHSAVDSERGILYSRIHDKLSVMNPRTGKHSVIEFDNNLPRLSWPTGVAIDTRRNRLLLTSHGGSGYLYAYDLTKKEWSVLRRPGISTAGIVYAADQDAVYAVVADIGRGNIRAVHRHNPHGALLERIVLSKPIRGGGHSHEGKMQLAYFDNHLAILQHRTPRGFMPFPGRGPAKIDGSITVVNLSTGAIVHEGSLIPSMERRDLSEQQLSALWSELARQSKDVDDFVWDMASGHDATVRFLAKKFAEPRPKLEVDIAKLIEQLDDVKFTVREAAFKKLQQLGSQIEPQIRESAANHKSAEVRGRLRRLLDAWKSAKPQNAQEFQQVRAVDVLSRIGSSSAKQLLEKIAAGQGSPVARSRASAALKDKK